MKISNETKVGALTAIAITVLILGFNFLKGKGLNARSNKLYTIFPNVEGLAVSNPVFINGLQVGRVSDIFEKDKNMTGVVVTMSLSKNINIPKNSLATISSELLSTTSVKIQLGSGTNYVESGDTLKSVRTLGMVEKLQGNLDPVIDNLNKTLGSLNDVVLKLNTILDPNTRNNLQSIIANLTASTKSLDQLLNTQTGMLAKSLKNVQEVTDHLAKNSSNIDTTISNLKNATGKLAKADIEGTVNNLRNTLGQLETLVGKINSKEGTLGLLLNDRQLYDEIRKTNRSLNTLLDDLRMHPKRYINISVFGRKDKKGPLMAPINDSIPK